MAARSRGPQVAAETGHGQGRGQDQAPAVGAVARPSRLVLGVERVEADPAPGAERHRLHAPGLGQGPVLALGVHHPGVAAEHRLTPQVGLHERALAPADLPEHDGVRVGDDPVPVEDEGVVDERAAEHVAADEDPLVAEAGLGDQGIGGAQVAGGGHVGRDPGGERGHERPRPRGRVQEKARSCSPKRRRSSIRAWPAACSSARRAAVSSDRVSAVTVT